MSAWMTTYTGRQFFPMAPRLDDIVIEDIAHALAAANRFNGHTREPYSVAQHSVLVSIEIERHVAPWDRLRAAFYGLLHDASEAYLCDVPRPLKRLDAFAAYREAERWLEHVIYARFGLEGPPPPALKLVDRLMLRTEQRDLMAGAPYDVERKSDRCLDDVAIVPWSAPKAEREFLDRFRVITRALALTATR